MNKTVKNQKEEDVSNTTVLVGDTLKYTITVKNTGNVPLENPVLNDYFEATGYTNIENALTVKILDDKDAEVSDAGATVTFKEWQDSQTSTGTGHNGKWTLNYTLPVGYTAQFVYNYTVQQEDAGKVLKNTATVDETHLDPDGGNETSTTVENPKVGVAKEGSVVGTNGKEAGMLVGYTVKVTNKGNVPLTQVVLKDSMADKIKDGSLSVTKNGSDVAFVFDKNTDTITIDSKLDVNESYEIKYTCAVLSEDLEDNKVTNKVDVTAKTEKGGESTDEATDTTTVYAGEITITPAPIVIYTGGRIGQTIVGTDGTIISDDLGLPVLGFLFQKSDDKNITVAENETLTLYDISGLRDGQYSWTAKAYNDNSTILYQLVAAQDAKNIRIQLTDKETDKVWDSSEFVIENYLYKQYETSIYTGLANNQNAEVVVKVGNDYYKMTSKPGTLTVRGTTDDVTTNQVVSSPENLNNTIDTPQAVVAPDAKYYYVSNNDEENTGTKLEVEDASSVSLLVDEIVDQTVETDQQYVQMMKNKVETEDSLLGAVPADTARVWRFYYMDLVLADNGNAVLTSDKDLTIYWPYPEGITYQDALSGKYDFTVLHYTGLDRNYKSETFGDELDQCNVVKYEITPTEQGLMFTVPAKDGFSPYALVYEYSTKPTEEPTAKPTEEPKAPEQTVTATGDDHPDIAEAKANGTWGQPTPTPAAGTVIPQTGDDMPLTALMGAAAVAAAALVVLVIMRRRRRKQ